MHQSHIGTHIYRALLLTLIPLSATALAVPAFPSATPYPLGDVKHTLVFAPDSNPNIQYTHDAPFDINNEIANFVKAAYKDLGDNNGNVTRTVGNNQGDFNKLNSIMNGELGEVLSTVLDIRTLELEMSLEHTRTMQDVIAGLMAHPNAVRGLP